MKKFLLLLIVAGIIFVVSTKVTVFVIPPMGFVTKGKTVVIPRPDGMGFLENAESACEQTSGPENLLCQALVLKDVSTEAEVLVRFPYSSTLDSLSSELVDSAE
ncbi:hypothetical protein [Pseudodesulfovibrio sediminis]|uniref:Uncharacterized protein n=1 Tax=Pseudodesulfovibrio sediminis TaxID=2810563 RepID=A0ABN6EU55_9BACT|nr:hypothetical protein [Pseudodesulfovibrio sediminis]BCS88584.1 hypothetical protein PSDVSF_18260 [Pseudodesulfovibrio sediminis]